MTVAAGDSSSSPPSHFTYLTSSSLSNRIQSMPDSGVDKSLKRKRSSSHHPQLLSDYPTPSPPESFDAVVKTEEQNEQQERGLIQKRKQEPLSPQESHDNSPRFLTLHHDASTTLLSQASSGFSIEKSCSKSASVIETPGQASYNSKEQGTQTGLELPVSEAYLNWNGRGRSPFKTPAIAAIDGLKKGAKVIEWLEREAAKEREQLEKLIQWKINLVTGLKRTRLEIVQDKMDPLMNIQVLVQPDVDNYEGKSKSPDKYLRKMKYSTPPVYYQRLEAYKHALPEQMVKLLGLLEENLGEGCIPSTYEVVQTMNLRQKRLLTSTIGGDEGQATQRTA